MSYDAIYESALNYVNLDLPVIPVCSHNHAGTSANHRERCKTPGKAPVLKQWSKHRHTTFDMVEEWFQINPKSNIGLVLGETEHWNLVGIDIDGELGEQMWQKLTAAHDLPETWEFKTGGGRRLIYSIQPGIETQKHRVCWKEGHEELAFLARGQQTIIPPSIHHTGKLYTWMEGKSPIDIDVADAPSWLVNYVTGEEVTAHVDGTVEVAETLPSFYGETLSSPVTAQEFMAATGEGGRSNQLTRFVGSLCAKREIPKETILLTAMQQNALYCDPPLEDAEIEAMVDSIWNSEQEKHAQRLQRQRKREEFNPAALAENFVKSLIEADRYWRYCSARGRMYACYGDKGPWTMLTEDEVRRDLTVYLKSLDPQLATRNLRADVLDNVEMYLMRTYGDGSRFETGRFPNMKYIATEEGLLDWSAGEIVPWDLEYYHTTQLAGRWTKDEQYQEVEKMWNHAMSQWLPDKQSVEFLQEYIGYALLPSCKMRTAVFLVGEGANGKSLFIDVVSKLFEGTIEVAQPHDLAHRFGTNTLVDKMLLVCSDIDSQYLDSTGVLKQIIAGDEIRAEYKGGKSFSIKPICKMLFSANRLPKSSDRSEGWYSRLQFVHFPKQFAPDPKYYEAMMTAMSSDAGKAVLLRWAVDGLRRLAGNSAFTISKSMAHAKGEYIAENDNVVLFAQECLRHRSDLATDNLPKYKTSLLVSALYTTYVEWASFSGVKAVGKGEFSSRLSRTALAGYPIHLASVKFKFGTGWRSSRCAVNLTFAEGVEFNAVESYTMQVGSMNA